MAASKLFAQTKPSKLSLDDTTPLTCAVESGEKIDDHVAYSLKVQRGLATDHCWLLKKRYTDFATLDSDLSTAGFDLPLPPKKLRGNFDREFVADRQLLLQKYLIEILKKPILANSLPMKRFLDPENYTFNFTEMALQQVSMVLRSEKQWEVVEPLPEIGWRIRKTFILVKPICDAKTKLMLSWVEFGPYQYLPEKELTGMMRVLENVKHPYIQTSVLSTSNENGGLVIKPFQEKGSLKDFLCKCKPRGHHLKKYARPPKLMCLDIQTVKSLGRQILETLSFLHEKGLPYCHLHTGNIVMDSEGCKLLELDNWLLGLPSFYRQFVMQFKKIKTTEMIDVYSFGHVMYEMVFGQPLQTPSCDEFPPRCDATLRSVLESILTFEACKNGLPTVDSLLTHPFFADTQLPTPFEKPVLKIPTKLKEPLKRAKEDFEKRLMEEQKVIYKKKRMSKAKEFHMSEDKKKERRISKKKALEAAGYTITSSPTTAASPSSSAPTAAPLQSAQLAPPAPTSGGPPPPPPPPAGVPPPPPQPPNGAPPAPPLPTSAPAPSGAGRGALLDSISGFSKGGLKKTVTVDKSGPRI